MKNCYVFLLLLSLTYCSSGQDATNSRFTPLECSSLQQCSDDRQCGQGQACIRALCGNPVCMNIQQACLKKCGTTNCPVLESYPIQIRCP